MQAQSDVRVTVRVDKGLKETADSLFERLGLNLDAAFNIFLRQAVHENAFPFLPHAQGLPELGHVAGLEISHISRAFEAAVANDIWEHQQKGHIIAGYDTTKKQAYLQSPNGTREYI